MSALEPKRVSIPPIDCCNFPPSSKESESTLPIENPASIGFKVLINAEPNSEPLNNPCSLTGFPSTCSIFPLMPFAEGIICTYAFPSSVAISHPPFLRIFLFLS